MMRKENFEVHMKNYAIIVLVLSLGGFASTPSADADTLPAGTLNFRNATIPTVLDVYGLLVDKELITDSRAGKVATPITLKNERPLSREQAVMLIEDALFEQAAILITPLGTNKASVTYNDALPIVASTSPVSPIERSASFLHFQVNTNSFFASLRSRIKPAGQQLEVNLLKDYFKQQGIDVSPPFSTLYMPATGDLLIRAREEDCDKIRRLIRKRPTNKRRPN